MCSFKGGADTCANIPSKGPELPAVPGDWPVEAQQGSPLGCWTEAWDPRHRGDGSPGSWAAESLILSGALHLLHRELGAALDVSAVTLSTSHLNCVRCSEKET